MTKIRVDMSNVEEFTLVPIGDYICYVANVTMEHKKDDASSKYLKWELVIGTGEYKNQRLFVNTSLKPKALFKLREMLVACGISVPKSTIEIDMVVLKKKVLGVTVVHTEYEGKTRPEVKGAWRPQKTEKGWINPSTTKAEEPEAEDDTAPWQDGGEEDEVVDIDV